MADPTPLTVIGGYLGAGKTTLVNRILAEPGGRQIAVLVNDFGAVNIDAALITQRDGQTISLANGCVCCSFADGLAMAILDVRDQIRDGATIDHVVIEVSGVGDPWKVAQWGRTPGFRLDGVVVLAAADSVVAKAADEFVGDTVRMQVAGADLVLVTRTDLCGDPGPALAWVEGHSSASVWSGATAQAPVALVLGEHEAAGIGGGSEHHDFISTTIDVPMCSPESLRGWLEAAPREVWRAKGIIATTVGAMVVQRVGHRVDLAARPSGDSAGPLVVIAEATSDAADQWVRQALDLG